MARFQPVQTGALPKVARRESEVLLTFETEVLKLMFVLLAAFIKG